jgi:hypothetical protein
MIPRALFAAAVVLAGLAPGTSAPPTFVFETREAVAAYANPAEARAAGYRLASVSGPMEHWIDPALVGDGVAADPRHPESLVYVETSSGLRLIGAMFLLDSVDQLPPAIGSGGWHSHSYCFGSGGLVTPAPGAPCPPNTARTDTPKMLHVWLDGVSRDPFAIDMSARFCRLQN